MAKVREDRHRPDPLRQKSPAAEEQPALAQNAGSAPAKANVPEEDGSAENEDDEAMDTDSDEEEIMVAPKPQSPKMTDSKASSSTMACATPEVKSTVTPSQEPPTSTDGPESARLDRTPPLTTHNSAQETRPAPASRQNSQHSPNEGHRPSGPRRDSSGYSRNGWQPHHHPGHHSNGQYANKRKFSQHNGQYGPHNPPPPPESHWNGQSRRRSGSMASNGSRHTEPGGDFEMDVDEHNKTPRNQSQNQKPGSGRKRDYDEMDRTNGGDRRRQPDDVTPRMRRGRPSVPDAYG